ncbi:MAG TPA: hypothetical protein VEI83_05035 [Acidimicrobiales bacterium]|nr:hypothetical protein [Acidimicrobiales bacterium]
MRNDDTAQGTCASCGLEATDLAPVHRAYLVADDAGGLELGELSEELEHWCGSCRSHYPHEPAGPGAAGA